MVLEGEDVADAVFKMIGPEIGRGHAVDQLHIDTHLPAFPPDAAFEHVAYSELRRHLSHIDAASLVNKGGMARDDRKGAEARKGGDDLRHHAIGKIILVDIATEIDEGKNRDGRRLRRHGRHPGIVPARQAITDPGNRDDPLRAIGPCAENLPERGNLNREVAFLHGKPRPGPVHQIRLGDDAALSLQQQTEQSCRPWSRRNGLPFPPQASCHGIVKERTKGKRRAAHAEA
ncbi:hypothetical protein ABIA10_000164 [Rhizobium leguminosarum]